MDPPQAWLHRSHRRLPASLPEPQAHRDNLPVFYTHTKKNPKLKDNLAKKRPEKVYEFKKMLM